MSADGRIPRVSSAAKGPTALLMALCGLATPAHAVDPGYYLVTAYENEGQASIDYRYWTVKLPSQPVVTWPEIGIGYGVTKRWYTEFYLSFEGGPGVATRLDTVHWQNDYLLTQGQYPFDLAVHTNLIGNRDRADGVDLEFGPALQTDMGRTQLNANVFFVRNFGADTPSPTQMRYQWQAKYRWKPWLQFGLQGFGELGPWDHWARHARQSHRAGPMLAGSWDVGAGQGVKYEAAWLSGSIYGRHGSMFSMRLQYLF